MRLDPVRPQFDPQSLPEQRPEPIALPPLRGQRVEAVVTAEGTVVVPFAPGTTVTVIVK